MFLIFLNNDMLYLLKFLLDNKVIKNIKMIKNFFVIFISHDLTKPML